MRASHSQTGLQTTSAAAASQNPQNPPNDNNQFDATLAPNKTQQPDDVIAATSRGFKLLLEAPSPLETPAALAALQAISTPLKGVGPATASALLAALEGSCPFMGDEALQAALGGSKFDYSVGELAQLRETLGAKAAELRRGTGVRLCALFLGGSGVACAANQTIRSSTVSFTMFAPNTAVNDDAPLHFYTPPGDDTWSAAWVERCIFLAALQAGESGANRKDLNKRREEGEGKGGKAKKRKR